MFIYNIIKVYLLFLLSSWAENFWKEKILDHGILSKTTLSITLQIDCFFAWWIFRVLRYVCSCSPCQQKREIRLSRTIKTFCKLDQSLNWNVRSYIGYISDAQFHLSLVGTVCKDYIVSSWFYLYESFLTSFHQNFT